jgi:hypothetical protein
MVKMYKPFLKLIVNIKLVKIYEFGLCYIQSLCLPMSYFKIIEFCFFIILCTFIMLLKFANFDLENLYAQAI